MNKVDLFNETMEYCSSNVKLVKAVENSKLKQEIFLEQEGFITHEICRYDDKAKIIIEQNRCAMACQGCGIAIFFFL